jgi:phospholipid-binding lipoprotein MlaA
MTSTRTRTVLLAALVAASLTACAPPAARGIRYTQARSDYDPLQPLNRKVFWLNDKVDVYVLEPVAKGWNRVAPKRMQRSVSNFFTNLRSPIVIVNDVLQGKMKNGATDVGRFAVNTTIGVVGLFDRATPLGLEQHVEDFGQTLGWWGLPPGPYLVIPLIGPSNPRDVVGMMGDSAASVLPWFVRWEILLGVRAGELVNTRALLLQQIDEAKRASFDYYVFVRNAYLQRRNALVNDSIGGTNLDQEELYHPQMDGTDDELYHPEEATPAEQGGSNP